MTHSSEILLTFYLTERTFIGIWEKSQGNQHYILFAQCRKDTIQLLFCQKEP